MAYEKLARLKIDKRSGYDITDVVRLFMLVSKKPMGRTALIRRLRLGEATVKTMVKFLKSEGIMNQGTRGVYPTEKAKSLFSFCSSLSELRELSIPGFSENAIALVVKGAASRVKSGIEQRDEGVRFGASIITLVKGGAGLELAGVPDLEPPYLPELEKSLEIGIDDVVVLSGADTKLAAERGAVAAALVTA